MSLTRFAIRRPVAIAMIIAALCLLGGMSYTQLEVKRLPDVNFPHVSVAVSYPGGSAENVRTELIEPIENAIASIGDIDTVTSNESNGHGRVNIRFAGGVDVNKKAAEVAHAVDAISGTFPSDVPAPTITKANPDAYPLLSVVVYGKASRSELYNLVTGTVQPEVARVPGVAEVTLTGGRQPQINISVNPELMNQYGVTLDDIVQRLGSAGKSVPGGVVQSSGRQLAVVTEGAVANLDDYKRLPVLQTPAGRTILLQQVANVSLGYAPIQTESALNGQTAMSLYVLAGSTANSLDVSNSVRETVGRLQSQLPAGVKAAILDDLTVYTRQALSAVQTDLFVAILVACLVLLLFLKRIRQTFIVVLAIPASLLLSGLAMYAMHFSLDTISLLALSLLIGILVDDAVVVLEAIDRQLRIGKPAPQAAEEGRAEIGWAAVAITLTDVVVYVPVAFMSGNVGQLFREFGLVIAFASLFSLFVSFTLTPMLAAWWLKSGTRRNPVPPKQSAAPQSLLAPSVQSAYLRLQRFFMKYWGGSVLLLLVCGSLLYLSFARGWIQTVYTPDDNEQVFSVKVTLPAGTAESVTRQAVQELSGQIRRLPHVQSVLATTGFGGGSATGSQIGRLDVELERGGRTADAIAGIDRLAAGIPGIKIQTSTPNPMLAESGGTIHVQLTGSDLAALDQIAGRIQTLMSSTPGITNVESSAEPNTPEYSIRPNDKAAAWYGLTAQQVGRAIRIAVQGETVNPFIPPGSLQGEPVVVQLARGQQLDLTQLRTLPVSRYGGSVVRLGDIAAITQGEAPSGESEVDRQLQISLIGNVSDSRLGTAAAQLRTAINRMGLPAGYAFKLAGAVDQQTKAFKPLAKSLNISILLIYMLLAALYESFLDPLVVLLMLPFAAAGGLAGFVLTGTPFSLYAFIAMIMLMGLVAKNAILLVDCAKNLRRRGMEPREAMLQAGQIRLRPILMTTVTMVLAMVPMALPWGTGAADRIPIALMLIGGLSLNTVLTLLVLPALYTRIWQVQAFVAGRFKRQAKTPQAVSRE